MKEDIKLTENNSTKEKNTEENNNYYIPSSEKELRYLEKLADDAMKEFKAGRTKPMEEFEWPV